MVGKHLEAGVLFQALKAEGEACQNYLAVSAALFSATRTISSASTGRESEKDFGRGYSAARAGRRIGSESRTASAPVRDEEHAGAAW